MYNYNGININYKRYGNKNGKKIILLHGWGQNISMMEQLGNNLKDYDIIIIDLPGHGESDIPKNIWTLNDFVLMIKSFLNSLKIDNPILVGHSFGGKISLLYASKYKVDRLILFASPFKVEMKKVSFKIKILKRLAKIPIFKNFSEIVKKHIGSIDYRNASGVMRDILVNHVNTDITKDLEKISCPTIIIWGHKDTTINIENGYILSNLIKDSALIEYENGTHFAYLEDLNKTIRIIKAFIGE